MHFNDICLFDELDGSIFVSRLFSNNELFITDVIWNFFVQYFFLLSNSAVLLFGVKWMWNFGCYPNIFFLRCAARFTLKFIYFDFNNVYISDLSHIIFGKTKRANGNKRKKQFLVFYLTFPYEIYNQITEETKKTFQSLHSGSLLTASYY